MVIRRSAGAVNWFSMVIVCHLYMYMKTQHHSTFTRVLFLFYSESGIFAPRLVVPWLRWMSCFLVEMMTRLWRLKENVPLVNLGVKWSRCFLIYQRLVRFETFWALNLIIHLLGQWSHFAQGHHCKHDYNLLYDAILLP